MRKTNKKTTDRIVKIAKRFRKLLDALHRDAADLVNFAFANFEDRTKAAGICRTTINAICGTIDDAVAKHGVDPVKAEIMTYRMESRVEELKKAKEVR